MKKKALLTSVMTIALCLCLIAGGTFALFTDKADFNIAVTAGKVDVEANATISAVYSAKGVAEGVDADDEYLVDENGYNYTHEKQPDNKTFLNKGEATLDGSNLKIDRMTPGDKVDVAIVATNNSNVAISYRYKISINKDDGLASGMVLSVLNDGDANTKDELTFAVESYEGFESYTSEWYYADAPSGTAEVILDRTISVELPVYAGNEYQEKSVEYTILVEAVQGNAVTTNDSTVTILPAALQNKLTAGSNYDGKGSVADIADSLWVEGKGTELTNITLDGADVAITPENDCLTTLGIIGKGNIVLGDGVELVAPINESRETYGMFLYGYSGETVITVKSGAKIVASGDKACAVKFEAGTATLVLEEAGLIELADNAEGIVVGASVVLTIKVPDDAAKAEYEAMLVLPAGDGTACTVNWVVG